MEIGNYLRKREHFLMNGLRPERYQETHLPPLRCFISKLSGKSITRQKYAELQQIWDSFQCANMEQFLEIYLESDVLMLADIFENFRDECLKNYHLDPCYFVSGPSLSYLSNAIN